jgi:flavodoxin
MKYTQSVVDKLEDILGESGYVVRYERGTFQSGWCLLEARKVVVLNKFLNTEGRINTLMEIIPQLAIDFDKLTHESQKLYEDVVKKSVTEA